jgi:hypothetical protein
MGILEWAHGSKYISTVNGISDSAIHGVVGIGDGELYLVILTNPFDR